MVDRPRQIPAGVVFFHGRPTHSGGQTKRTLAQTTLRGRCAWRSPRLEVVDGRGTGGCAGFDVGAVLRPRVRLHDHAARERGLRRADLAIAPAGGDDALADLVDV